MRALNGGATPPGEDRPKPLVGIIRNPRSHLNKGSDPEDPNQPHLLMQTPRNREELRKTLADFAARKVSYLVISGGDGTLRDVLTCGHDAFGDNWPEVILLPRGKTNAMAVDLGLPHAWNVLDAFAAARAGKRLVRQPMVIRSRDVTTVSVLGFVLGAGAFAIGTELGQEAHRRGAFQSFAVGVTILWSALQAMFGGRGNRWREPVGMTLWIEPKGTELPHGPHGRPGRRFIFLASSLDTFPLGIKPFGRIAREGLRYVLIDTALRRVLLCLPYMLLTGRPSGSARRWGIHRGASAPLAFDIDDRFVVDGEFFPAGSYQIEQGPRISFVVP